jgi:L-ascorbate metabolism protein UlaG (beta-lactamase superfamily)
MKRLVRTALSVAAIVAGSLGVANTAQAAAEVLWLGQATVKITSVEGKVIVIDPFLKKNPKTPAKYKDLKALGKVDLILITHGHFDHVADLKELAAMSGAKVVGNGAMTRQLAQFGVIGAKQGISMNKSGTIMPLPGIKVHMVPAEHSSALTLPHPKTGDRHTLYAGMPVGYVVELEDGFKIYHSGDTGVFGDMGLLVGEMHSPDVALICIGGHFTMDPAGAAYAVKNLLNADKIIPIHYGTFPPLKGTPAQLKAALGGMASKVMDVVPGQAVTF